MNTIRNLALILMFLISLLLFGEEEDFRKFAMFAENAERAKPSTAKQTKLPLTLEKKERIALIGNTLFDRMRNFGHFEALIQKAHPKHEIVLRNLSWSADEIDLQPRPANFADIEQHLTSFGSTLIIAAFGFNESFAGNEGKKDFEIRFHRFLNDLKSKTYDGISAPKVVIISPIPNENVAGVNAASMNNANLETYTGLMEKVAKAEKVGFVNCFQYLLSRIEDLNDDLTINGCHLNEMGYLELSKVLFQNIFSKPPPPMDKDVKAAVIEKNTQHFFRYRPLNTFYYTGGRRSSYGYLDFLPAMRNFDIMTSNRDQRIHKLVMGLNPNPIINDSNVPPLPITKESRGANQWLSPQDE